MKQKKLLYVISLDLSQYDGVMNRCVSFVNCFKNNGYNVTVVALTPFIGRVVKSYKNIENLPSIAKWLVFPFFKAGKRSWKNIFVYIDKIYILFLTCLLNPKYILADSHECCEVASWSTMISPLIANFRADVVDEKLYSGRYGFDSPDMKEDIRKIKHSIKISSYSICVSNHLKEILEKQSGLTLNNNFIFPCCCDLERFSKIIPHIPDDKFIIGFFGGSSKWHCMDEILDLFLRLRKLSNRYFLLILTGSDMSIYKNKLEVIGNENYSIKKANIYDIPNMISSMDLSVAIRENRELNKVSSPTKLSESLAAGVPLLVTRYSGDYKELMVNNNTGIVINDIFPTNEELLAIHNYCSYVMNNRLSVFNHCREAVANRTQEIYSKQFVNFIENKRK